MPSRPRIAVATGAAMLLSLSAIAPVGAQDAGSAATEGRFLAPFAEPTISGQPTDQTCVRRDDGTFDCKPAAGSIAVLPQGGGDDLVYFNALEGTENVRGSIVSEFGTVSINAQARRLDLNGGSPTWRETDSVDSGINRDGNGNNYLVPGNLLNSTETYNDGSLFCADLNFLADGRVMTVGGTSYYQEPGNDALPIGVVELEGNRNTRIYDPETNQWSEVGAMNFGRWYPTLVTLDDGGSFVASGVEKLLKPVYPDKPMDSLRNVTQTEVFDPVAGEWEYTGVEGDKSLPLFPRLHLLPNGHVYYNTAGQVFNPFGQAYDEPLWNIASAWNPDTQGWTDLGVPGIDELAEVDSPEDFQEYFPEDMAATAEEFMNRGMGAFEALAAGLETMDFGPAVQQGLGMMSTRGLEGIGSVLGAGFRGSTFSIMLPLEPNASGDYETSEFLTAGGAVGPTPGSYFPIPFSRIDTVDTSNGPNGMDLSSRWTGSMNTARWYSSGVLLPDGQVLAVNGSTADEVVGPGTGFPVTQAELFNPDTEQWTPAATQGRDRVYHNTATLLPDATVLLGGHDMISTLYASNLTLPGGFTPSGRDPSFEIYEPPYLHYGVDQPRILNGESLGDLEVGGTLDLQLDINSQDVDSVVLVRNTSTTHLVDGDQRSVELPITRRAGNRVTVQLPDQEAVMPPGPYLLFANRATEQGPVPSVAAQLTRSVDATYAAGEDRTDAEVGERPEAAPGLNGTVPEIEDTVPGVFGDPPPDTPNSDPDQPVDDTSATAEAEADVEGADVQADDGADAPDAPELPLPDDGPVDVDASTDDGLRVDVTVDPEDTSVAAAGGEAALAGSPTDGAPWRAPLVALAMLSILVAVVAHGREWAARSVP